MTAMPDDRGQTVHDFAIGMVIFLLVLGYVFAFFPGMFEPFSPEVDSTPIQADRTADYLTQDLLVENGSEEVLNVSCTELFFDVGQATATDCDRLTQPGDEAYIRELAALSARTSVNVTMVRTEGPATYSGGTLAVGPSVDAVDAQIIRAVRVVTFDGRDYRFVVRLW